METINITVMKQAQLYKVVDVVVISLGPWGAVCSFLCKSCCCCLTLRFFFFWDVSYKSVRLWRRPLVNYLIYAARVCYMDLSMEGISQAGLWLTRLSGRQKNKGGREQKPEQLSRNDLRDENLLKSRNVKIKTFICVKFATTHHKC